MFNTLRNRLILSNILPLLVIIPLMGIALIYVLENQYLLPKLSEELTADTRLLDSFTSTDPTIWMNSTHAQTFLNRVKSYPTRHLMLISSDGNILASSDPADANRLNQALDINGLKEAQKGIEVQRLNYIPSLHSQAIDIFSPVIGSNHQVIGIIRLTYPYENIYVEFTQTRFLIIGILIIGLLTGTILGLILALNIGKPIQKVTEAVYNLAGGDHSQQLTEQGPEETRLLLRAVNFLTAQLSSLEQSRQQLLANIVHELGRPLGALHSATQALLRGAKNDPQLLDDLLVGMDEETMRLQRLLDDLSRLYNQRLGTLELNYQAVPLSVWFPRVLIPWQVVAQEKSQHWEVTVLPNLPTIQADPDRLAQAIGNLISNAIKYTPTRESVSVSAGSDNNSIWIQVRDTGPGIPPEEQELIFEPNYRSTQRQRIKQGMGLGLSIVRDLVNAHGGILELKSTPGMGSRFTIRLPVSPGEPLLS